MGEAANYILHHLSSEGIVGADDIDQETVGLLTDLVCVMGSLHRGMPVYGKWFEERIRSHLVELIPDNWSVSGPSQIYDPSIPDVRSRSWDLVVHLKPEVDLPPMAAVNCGFPLIPKQLVCMVIDTKTMFNNISEYTDKTVSNLRANNTQKQLDFLGPNIKKVILAASSACLQSTLWEKGQKFGIDVYCLSKSKASRVDEWENRKWELRFQYLKNGDSPFLTFLNSVSNTISSYKFVEGLQLT